MTFTGLREYTVPRYSQKVPLVNQFKGAVNKCHQNVEVQFISFTSYFHDMGILTSKCFRSVETSNKIVNRSLLLVQVMYAYSHIFFIINMKYVDMHSYGKLFKLPIACSKCHLHTDAGEGSSLKPGQLPLESECPGSFSSLPSCHRMQQASKYSATISLARCHYPTQWFPVRGYSQSKKMRSAW